MTEQPRAARRTLTIGAIALTVMAVGWFLLSVRVAHSDARTAAGESIGVTLGLLVLASVIGAARGHHDGDG